MRLLSLTFLVFLVVALPLTGQNRDAADTSKASPEKKPNYTTTSIRGRVVWMADALKRRYDISTVMEAKERQLAIETKDGQLVALVEDVRTRAFRRDKRLWPMDLELLVRRHHGSPVVQIIRLYSWEEGRRLEVDYWCDICAIPMFEKKDCDCCQGDTELRKTLSSPAKRHRR